MKMFFTRPCRRGFTMIEIMIVVAILGIIMAIAGSTWLRQRLISQQRVCQENLTKIYGAKQQWALEQNQPSDVTPAWNDLVNDNGGYLKRTPVCPGDGIYALGAIDNDATCSITSPEDHNAVPNASATASATVP